MVGVEQVSIKDQPRYQLGNTDQECRYPVLIDGKNIGLIYRWHGAWFAIPAGTSKERRVGYGSTGSDTAAQHLVAEFNAGRITPQQDTETPHAKPRRLMGPVPLLHPRMPASARNVETAHKAMAGLTEYLWTPFGGYPGADNPWFLRCQLCGWTGPRYWSHLRGRNGNPPSPFRHPGCLEAGLVRSRIAAYQK